MTDVSMDRESFDGDQSSLSLHATRTHAIIEE